MHKSELFKSKLDEFDIASELHLAKNTKHGDEIFDSEEYLKKVIRFLDKHFPAN